MMDTKNTSPNLVSIIEKPFHWTLRYGALFLTFFIIVFLIFLYNFKVTNVYELPGKVLKVIHKNNEEMELIVALYTDDHPFRIRDTISMQIGNEQDFNQAIITSRSDYEDLCIDCNISITFKYRSVIASSQIIPKETKISIRKTEKKSLLSGFRAIED
ncbi:hypothetical protein [Sinomicrobium oceani]|uniref:hypothetical protein n=1 Tax=Sinomicrobium oceani TaxID=1150368 RepID=UPI00227B26C8|nr:hypothetical protein [Sinomicrobium oceani]